MRVRRGVPRRIRGRLSKLLYGTTVTIKGKRYRARGLLDRIGAIVLCPGAYLVPVSRLDELLDELSSRGLGGYLDIDASCLCSPSGGEGDE